MERTFDGSCTKINRGENNHISVKKNFDTSQLLITSWEDIAPTPEDLIWSPKLRDLTNLKIALPPPIATPPGSPYHGGLGVMPPPPSPSLRPGSPSRTD